MTVVARPFKKHPTRKRKKTVSGYCDRKKHLSSALGRRRCDSQMEDGRKKGMGEGAWVAIGDRVRSTGREGPQKYRESITKRPDKTYAGKRKSRERGASGRTKSRALAEKGNM